MNHQIVLWPLVAVARIWIKPLDNITCFLFYKLWHSRDLNNTQIQTSGRAWDLAIQQLLSQFKLFKVLCRNIQCFQLCGTLCALVTQCCWRHNLHTKTEQSSGDSKRRDDGKKSKGTTANQSAGRTKQRAALCSHWLPSLLPSSLLLQLQPLLLQSGSAQLPYRKTWPKNCRSSSRWSSKSAH